MPDACPCCGVVVCDEEMEGPAWALADLFRLDPLLADKVEADAESGCWIWTGAQQRSGHKGQNVYGRICRRRSGGWWLIHRWVYRLCHGEIPPGHDVHHRVEPPVKCTSTLCCNPRHLEAIDSGEHSWLHNEMDSYAAA